MYTKRGSKQLQLMHMMLAHSVDGRAAADARDAHEPRIIARGSRS